MTHIERAKILSILGNTTLEAVIFAPLVITLLLFTGVIETTGFTIEHFAASFYYAVVAHPYIIKWTLGKRWIEWKRKNRSLQHESLARSTVEKLSSPILYLRPFNSDSQGTDDKTVEEMVALAFKAHGPFIAVGNPKESSPALGAKRVYVGSQKWETYVASLISKAEFVITLVGASDGLKIEIELMRRHLQPYQAILLVPNNRDQYSKFVAMTSGLFPHPLPNLNSARYFETWIPLISSRRVHIVGVIRFAENWSATYSKLPLESQGGYGGITYGLRKVLRLPGEDVSPLNSPSIREFVLGVTVMLFLIYLII